MNYDRFAGLKFERTQPREWRDMPFEGDAKIMPVIFKGIGIALFWLALLGLSLWSINDSVSNSPITQMRTK